MKEPTDKDPNTGTPPQEQPKEKPKRIRKKPATPRPKAEPQVPPPAGKAKARLIDEIRRLQIPARAKAELAVLCMRAKELGRKLLRFLARHRYLGEAAVLGAFVAYALCFIPWIGAFLALVALGLSLASGVVRQLREDLAALFATETACA